jgi:hypothetical protein
MNKFTEIIDKYLSGLMNETEKADFEGQLKSNRELKSEFDLQSKLLKGIERQAIKQSLQKGMKTGSLKSKLYKLGIGTVIVALATMVALVVKNEIFSVNKKNVRYELNEENKKIWSDADKFLSPQIFKVQGNRDTVIETTGGILIAIPAHSFLNNTADEVDSEIEVEVKEALNAFDIMKAGLSTTSDGKLLETGGMFYVNARQDGKNLSIVQNKGLYVNIPNHQPDKNMMLFEGKRTENGQIFILHISSIR